MVAQEMGENIEHSLFLQFTSYLLFSFSQVLPV